MLRKHWLAFFLSAVPLAAASYYTGRLDDPKAVYLTKDAFPVHGDGAGDDAVALQQAIDRVQETARAGIVFIPEGRYRLGNTVNVWPGIRLIGYGARRPVLVLGANTPGFQEGPGKHMLFFAGWRPKDPGQPVPDGTPGTFYSAASNIDMEIGPGNPAAIGVRFHVAQHCYLAHMDFRIGSGKAALENIGNEGEDLHFYGGDYGIVTRKTAPSWQYLLIDSTFEGQRVAAIRTQEAGLTLVRDQFKSVPTAVSINPDYPEELWMKDCRFEDIAGPALVVSLEKSARTQVNVEDAVCLRVPRFASFRESGRSLAGPAPAYSVRRFSHGLHLEGLGGGSRIDTTFDARPLPEAAAAVASDIPGLPDQATWVNVRSLGVKGDGQTDDTAALRAAIAGNKVLYLPMGRYRVTDTLTLRPDSVLIGLHPSATMLDVPDGTAAFQGPGAPKPLLEAPRGGNNIVTGIGLYTEGNNSRAVAAKWMSGARSLMNDVRFLGGHGTAGEDIYNNTHTADPNPNRRWDSQYCSLWITDGGGGTFKDIWTPSTFAQAGFCITNTSTEGRMYEISIEHHVRHEAQIRNASNWRLYALQFEEERGESAEALPLEIDRSSNITLANTFLYRVVSSYAPAPWAVKVQDSRDIRFRNLHNYTDAKASFDQSVSGTRENEFAVLDLGGRSRAPRPSSSSAPQLLASGFYNIAGLAVDAKGTPYFVDARKQTIYRWTPAGGAEVVRDNPLDPVQLAFDKQGNLLVVSYGGQGTVYAFRPDSPDLNVKVLAPQPAAPRPGGTALLPVNRWRNQKDMPAEASQPRPYHYLAPDGVTFLPAGEDFVRGQLYYGTKMADVLRAFALAPVPVGKSVYVCDERELRTYLFDVQADGSLAHPRLFVEQGGPGLAVDGKGNVYIAAGEIYVYNPAGRQIGRIDVPERPSSLAFGGPDGRTLFIAARTSLYSVRVE